MHTIAVKMILEEAEDDYLISVFVFNNPIHFTKKDYYVTIHDDVKLLELYTKKGDVKHYVIDIDSIKYLHAFRRLTPGADPRTI